MYLRTVHAEFGFFGSESRLTSRLLVMPCTAVAHLTPTSLRFASAGRARIKVFSGRLPDDAIVGSIEAKFPNRFGVREEIGEHRAEFEAGILVE
jgi:hypothetical protein